jgi:predicted N-acyltransferase
MPENVMLVIASREGRPIAASLLHFETCYYQVIEYCISRGLLTFEGGAQGEHTKLARGLLPTETCSAHWIARRDFASAIESFLTRETEGIAHHLDELNERKPFKELPEGSSF